MEMNSTVVQDSLSYQFGESTVLFGDSFKTKISGHRNRWAPSPEMICTSAKSPRPPPFYFLERAKNIHRHTSYTRLYNDLLDFIGLAP